MNDRIGFTGCERVLGKAYNGANGKKIAVVYNGEQYMLKFPPSAEKKPTELSYTNSCISEHIASSIFNMLGINAQKTLLGTFFVNGKEKIVCACKDFTDGGKVLYDFCSINNTIIDSERDGSGTAISVYSGNTLVQTIDRVLSATLKESLEGELTLEFSTLADRSGGVDIGCVAHFEDSYFNIVRISKTISSGLMVTTAVCAHISYILNNDEYKLTEFNFTGGPLACLESLLVGTQLIAGESDFTEDITLQINKQCTRRAALIQLVALVNGELEYSGDNINLRSHRGSTVRSELMDTRNVTDVSVTRDSRSSTTSYEIAFHRKAECSVGDEVHILFSPLGINVNTRIISMEYNPFYKYSIRVEVGSYVPVFNSSLYEKETDTELEDIAAEVETLTGDVETINTDISTINTDLGDLTTDLGDLTTDFETINTDVTNLTTDLGDLSSDVTTLSTNCQSKCRRFIVIAESVYDTNQTYGEVGDVIAVVED